ncbi:MAG: DUF2225 domain-containing protein [Cellulosilyticum sp.]|nr:DUF2225 domain-containing protein [Cellulosilyticum sp.]
MCQQGICNEEILKEMIYEKEYECPLCKTKFKQKAVKSSKNKLLDIDFDLNARYEKVNPLYYEVVVCEVCGFAQLNKRSEMPTLAEASLLKEKIAANFLGRKYSTYYTAQEAIDRYKLALLNAIVRNATEGEKAYIALKLAWVYREIGDSEEEKRFLGEALKSFLNAYQREGFPIFELQEEVVAYLIAALSYQLENYKQAIKWIQMVLKNPNTSPKLKDRCFSLKAMVSEKEKELKQLEEQNKL